MDLRQLRYFRAVASLASFTAAAKALHISQPALSYHIRQLEEELGVTLLERHSRGVATTSAGEVLLGRVSAIFSMLEAIDDDMVPFRGVTSNKLLLGATPTFCRILGPALVMALGRNSGTSAIMDEKLAVELIDLLLADQLDAAFCYQTSKSSQLPSVGLFSEELHLVGPPELIDPEQGDIRFEDAVKFDLVLDQRSHRSRDILENVARDRGVQLRPVQEVAPNLLKHSLITRHGTCSLVPVSFVSDDIISARIRARRICDPVVTSDFFLFFRANLPEETCRMLTRTAKDIIGLHMTPDSPLRWKPVSEVAVEHV